MKKQGHNLNRILEIFWLIIAVITFLTGIYSAAMNGLRSSYMFFIMTVLSLLLYLARRSLRKRDDN